MSLILLSAGMFVIGLYGGMSRRDLVGVLASVEIMLGSATVLLVGLAQTAETTAGIADPSRVEAAALMILVLAAAEAAVGLALLVAVGLRVMTTRVDGLTEVNG